MIAVAPVGLEEIAPEWIEERREIVAREGRALRAGRGASIEIKSLTPHDQLTAHDPLRLNEWLRLALPGGATECRTAAERDDLLARLVGGATASDIPAFATLEALLAWFEAQPKGKYALLHGGESTTLTTPAPEWKTLAEVKDPRSAGLAWRALKACAGV